MITSPNIWQASEWDQLLDAHPHIVYFHENRVFLRRAVRGRYPWLVVISSGKVARATGELSKGEAMSIVRGAVMALTGLDIIASLHVQVENWKPRKGRT